jgi:uncharacterized protein
MQVDFLIILLFVSMLYSSVGHGGASGYLALMAIYGFAPETMKPSALILNLFVAGISFIQFYRKGHFNFRLLWPFAITSIPMAFLGGMIQLDAVIYKRVLGVLLIFAVLRLLGVFGNNNNVVKEAKLIPALLIGGAIGFFSGLIGIGGGIILSPVIMLLGWGDVKQTAAVSALFIWINSVAGLLGMASIGLNISFDIIPYILTVIVGGTIGAYLGSFRWNYRLLSYFLSFVLALASIKLIFI